MAVPQGRIATAVRITVTVALVAAFAAPVAAIPDWLKDPSYGDPVDLSKRRNLEQPITLEREDITVADFFQWLEDEHEIRLKAEEPALTKHLAIFVKERPAWEVLEAVAGSLHAEWRLYLSNLWLRLSHAPDDIKGLSQTLMSLLGDHGFIADSDPITGEPTTNLQFAEWAKVLEPPNGQQLLNGQLLSVSALSPAARRALLDAIRESVADHLFFYVQSSLIVHSSTLALGAPGSVCAFWIQWNGSQFSFVEHFATASGASQSSGGQEGLERTLELAPGDGAQTVLEGHQQESSSTDPEWAGDFHRQMAAIKAIAQERNYWSTTEVSEPPSRTPPGFELSHLSSYEPLARHSLDTALYERVRRPFPNLPRLTPLGIACRTVSTANDLNVVTLILDDRTSSSEVRGARGFLASIEEMNEAFTGDWYAVGQSVYFAPRLLTRPLHRLILSLLAVSSDYAPQSWKTTIAAYPSTPADRESRGSRPRESLWEILIGELNGAQREHLRHDVLFWQDLSPEQHTAVLNAVWEDFLRNYTDPLPAPLKRQLTLISEAETLDGTLQITEDRGGMMTLHFEGLPFDHSYPLPPGILAHLIKLKQQADAEAKAGTSAPPPH